MRKPLRVVDTAALNVTLPVARFDDLITDRKAGKAVITVNAGATVLRPQRVIDIASDRIAVATTRGKLLSASGVSYQT